MEGVDPGALPLWVQIMVALITALGGAFAVIMGRKVGTQSPSPPPSNQMFHLIGGALADKHSAQAFIEALDRIVDELQQHRKENRRFREAFEAHTDKVVAEHIRLREEATEIKRQMASSHQAQHGDRK